MAKGPEVVWVDDGHDCVGLRCCCRGCGEGVENAAGVILKVGGHEGNAWLRHLPRHCQEGWLPALWRFEARGFFLKVSASSVWLIDIPAIDTDASSRSRSIADDVKLQMIRTTIYPSTYCRQETGTDPGDPSCRPGT